MKKRKTSKNTQTTASAEQDVVGLITTLVQRLVTLESKIDMVLSRTSSRPAETPVPRQQQSAPAPAPRQPANTRPMYKVICADCGKDSEVPFRPSADRPVYCKACFTVRRNNGTFTPRPPVPEKPQAIKPPAPIEKKKPAAKKPKKKKS
jgi:CxxC-x17-CxxC domain-containing protein